MHHSKRQAARLNWPSTIWVVVGVDDDWQVAASTSKAHHTQKTKEIEQRATWLSTESEYPSAYVHLKLDRAQMDRWLMPISCIWAYMLLCSSQLASWPHTDLARLWPSSYSRTIFAVRGSLGESSSRVHGIKRGPPCTGVWNLTMTT